MSETPLQKILRTKPIKSITQRRDGIICIQFQRSKLQRVKRYQTRPKPHDFSKAQTKLNCVDEIKGDKK